MLHDLLTRFASATSVGTPNNSIVNVGSQVDVGAAGLNLGASRAYLVIQVTTAIGSGGASKFRFLLVSDGSASISTTAANRSEHWRSPQFDITSADLAAGTRLVVPLPPEGGGVAYEQFLGVQIIEENSVALNAGAIDAFITLDPPSDVSLYADASN